MTIPQPDGHLPAAQTRLENAITNLTAPTYDGTNGQWREIPSLYHQLYDALPGGYTTRLATIPRSTPPLWLEAAQLLAQIDTAVRKWQPAYPHTENSLPTVERLSALKTRRWRPQDVTLIHAIATQLEEWTALTETLLYPPEHTGLYLDAACPACGSETALHQDSAGEYVRNHALTLDLTRGVTCGVCRYHWPPERCKLLAIVIGCDALSSVNIMQKNFGPGATNTGTEN